MKHLKAHLKASCSNCYYAQQLFPHEFYCYGQKGAPRVSAHSCCDSYTSRYRTKADEIRTMTDEELAEKISKLYGCSYCPGFTLNCENQCKKYWLMWLRSPAKEE